MVPTVSVIISHSVSHSSPVGVPYQIMHAMCCNPSKERKKGGGLRGQRRNPLFANVCQKPRLQIDAVRPQLGRKLEQGIHPAAVLANSEMARPAAERDRVLRQVAQRPVSTDTVHADQVLAEVRQVEHVEPRVRDDVVRVAGGLRRRVVPGRAALSGPRPVPREREERRVALGSELPALRVERERRGRLAVVVRHAGEGAGWEERAVGWQVWLFLLVCVSGAGVEVEGQDGMGWDGMGEVGVIGITCGDTVVRDGKATGVDGVDVCKLAGTGVDCIGC